MSTTPESVLAAGREYLVQLTSVDDTEPERDLLLSLGPISVGSLGHRRAVTLCSLAVRRVIHRRGWPTLGTIQDIQHCLELVDGWLQSLPEPSLLDWSRACHVDDWCRGKPCMDWNTEYSFIVFSMIAALGRVTMYAGMWDGVDVLREAPYADAPFREIEFHTWLVNTALPAAHDLQRTVEVPMV